MAPDRLSALELRHPVRDNEADLKGLAAAVRQWIADLERSG